MKKVSTLFMSLIILILLVVIVGGGFYFFYEKNKSDNEIQNLSNEVEELKKRNDENNTNMIIESYKKIDENKPWVYDAEYGKDYTEKKFEIKETNQIYSTTDMLKIPYINIDSEEAKKVNEEIKIVARELYEKFGKKDGDSTYYITSMNYEYSSNENEISVLMLYDIGISNTGARSNSIKAYNFKLNNDSDNKNSNIGGYSKENINAIIDEFNKKENRNDGDKIEIVEGEYFIFNKNVYVVCIGGFTSGGVRSSSQYTLFNINQNKEINYSEIKKEISGTNNPV